MRAPTIIFWLLALLAALVVVTYRAEARDITVSWYVPGTQRACTDSTDAADPERYGFSHVIGIQHPEADTMVNVMVSAVGKGGTRDSLVVRSVPDSVHYIEWAIEHIDAAGLPSCTWAHLMKAYPPDTTTAPPPGPGARVEQQFWSGNFGALLRTEWPETVDMDSTGASYSVRWEGNLEVPAGGARLYVVHDDAARLYVDGVWRTTQSSCTDAQNVQAWDVAAGVRAIRVDFIGCASPQRCRLEWDSATMQRAVIPGGAWR